MESLIISDITSSKTALLSGHILFGWLGPGSSLSLVESVNQLISSISIYLTVALMILPEKNLSLNLGSNKVILFFLQSPQTETLEISVTPPSLYGCHCHFYSLKCFGQYPYVWIDNGY